VDGRGDRPSRVDRRVVDGDGGQVDEGERESDRDAGESGGAPLRVRHAEDDEDEDGGEEDLGDDRSAEAEAAGGVLAEAVARASAGLRRGQPRLGGEGPAAPAERRRERRADDLRDRLAGRVLPAEAAGGRQAEGDGRVEVST